MNKKINKSGGGIALSMLLFISVSANVYFCKKEGYWNYMLVKMHVREKKEIKQYPPDYWAVRGWTSCLQKMRLKWDVCFYGHSQIEMSDFQKDFPNKKIIELGYPGDGLDGMIKRVNQIKYTQPNKVFLLAGTNSLWYKKEDFEDKYQRLVWLIQKENPYSKLYIFSILPQREGTLGSSRLNAIIKERNSFIGSLCKKNGLKFFDIYNLYVDVDGNLAKEVTVDGVHLKRNCYGEISKLIKPYI